MKPTLKPIPPPIPKPIPPPIPKPIPSTHRLRVGFININDMYNNDVGKGVVYAYEAYEAK
jgi:hypothetical protein